jgi:membrane protein DedA with SNARE-associated domain
MTETQTLIASLDNLSYLGIFGISMLANVVIPVPEEVVLLALGYISRIGTINIFYLIPTVIAGLLASDIILYLLSQKNNRFVTYFYAKFFAKRLADKHDWVDHNINKVIFFSRFLIQLRFLGPFMAGQHGVKFRTFITYELAALLIYVPLIVWTGWYFQSRVERIVGGVGLVRNIFLIGVGLIVVISLLRSAYKALLKAPSKK